MGGALRDDNLVSRVYVPLDQRSRNYTSFPGPSALSKWRVSEGQRTVCKHCKNMRGFNRNSFYCGMKIWRTGSKSLLRRLRHKSTTLLNEYDVKCLKQNVHLFSATLKYDCPAPGQPLSSIYMPVRISAPISLKVLSPSLIKFAEDAANGCKFEGAFHKAFRVLERGLTLLTDTKTESGLSQTFWDAMNGILQIRKRATKSISNAEIAEQIILPLIDGFIILNASYDDGITVRSDSPLYHPSIKGWKGLGLGHPSAWYGEIDMLVCNGLKPDDCQIAVISEDCDDEDSDPEDLNSLPDASLAVEGKNRISKDCSLVDGQFGQGFATAVTYSFIYHYGHSFEASLVPTIQLSPDGFQVFLYDCRTDVMLAQSFLWERSSLIFLWAILHHFLFFPPTINTKAATSLYSFGYVYRSGGFDTVDGFHALKKDQLYFGLHRDSKKFQKKKSQFGRLIKTYT